MPKVTKRSKMYSFFMPEYKNDDGNVVDGGYWQDYDTKMDAVKEANGLPIYTRYARRLGVFTTEEVIVQVKSEAKKPYKRRS